MTDLAHHEAHAPINFLMLLFGASSAPIFWLGQIALNYAITAYACYPGDHPVAITSSPTLKATMLVFDGVAILAAIAGGAVAWLCFVRTGAHARAAAMHPAAEGRAHFIAVWGVFSSLWFLGAILFTTIASLTVPPCPS